MLVRSNLVERVRAMTGAKDQLGARCRSREWSGKLTGSSCVNFCLSGGYDAHVMRGCACDLGKQRRETRNGVVWYSRRSAELQDPSEHLYSLTTSSMGFSQTSRSGVNLPAPKWVRSGTVCVRGAEVDSHADNHDLRLDLASARRQIAPRGSRRRRRARRERSGDACECEGLGSREEAHLVYCYC